jgi:hypothetical protein
MAEQEDAGHVSVSLSLYIYLSLGTVSLMAVQEDAGHVPVFLSLSVSLRFFNLSTLPKFPIQCKKLKLEFLKAGS